MTLCPRTTLARLAPLPARARAALVDTILAAWRPQFLLLTESPMEEQAVGIAQP